MFGDGNFFNTQPSVLELGNFIEQKVCVLCVTCTPYNYKVPQSVIYDLNMKDNVYMYDLYMYMCYTCMHILYTTHSWYTRIICIVHTHMWYDRLPYM